MNAKAKLSLAVFSAICGMSPVAFAEFGDVDGLAPVADGKFSTADQLAGAPLSVAPVSGLFSG